jgi:serine/threonine protein kinase
MIILREVHSAGYTYNDLKPDNIMLNNSSNGQVNVTLIDFGYAKQI